LLLDNLRSSVIPFVISSRCEMRASGNPARILSDVRAHVSRFINESSRSSLKIQYRYRGAYPIDRMVRYQRKRRYAQRCRKMKQRLVRSRKSFLSLIRLPPARDGNPHPRVALHIDRLRISCRDRRACLRASLCLFATSRAIGVPIHVTRVGILRADFPSRTENAAISLPAIYCGDRFSATGILVERQKNP